MRIVKQTISLASKSGSEDWDTTKRGSSSNKLHLNGGPELVCIPLTSFFFSQGTLQDSRLSSVIPAEFFHLAATSGRGISDVWAATKNKEKPKSLLGAWRALPEEKGGIPLKQW